MFNQSVNQFMSNTGFLLVLGRQMLTRQSYKSVNGIIVFGVHNAQTATGPITRHTFVKPERRRSYEKDPSRIGQNLKEAYSWTADEYVKS